MSHAPHHYNPDWLDDDALVAGFIARQGEFKFLRDELARAPREGSVQHYLLIGPRGAGKTTLLKRLAVAIRREEQLSDHLIALSFPEELYQVKDLTDFWWAACEALGDELDRCGDKTRASQLFDAVDRARASRVAPTSEDGLKTLLTCAAEIQRRPVLLVDNLDLVFERIDKKGRKLKDPLSPAYWALREALSTTSSPIVIGGSVCLSEPFTDYDKAFYDFFLPKRLGKLGLAEVRQVLEYLAEQQDSPEIKQRLRERPARIDALYDLTGGNPRAIGFIFQLLQQGPNSRVVEDFERLMDLTTPYYKARFEDLSEQAQVVMHALATRRTGDGSALRFGHTAAEIATYAGLPTNTVSAQMDVLEREGLIEKSAAHGRTQYRIAEQLFRLWLQMRSSRRIRQNVIGLAEFLEAMYDLDEMNADIENAAEGIDATCGTRGNLGELFQGPGKHEEAISAFWKAADLRQDGAQYWQERHRRLLDQPLLEASRQALHIGNLSAIRESLNELLLRAEDISATLASRAFIEDVLAPALADEHKASAVLGLLWGLGYDKHARPLLLAFEAAVEKRPEALEDLEPEVRAAARRMYERLIGESTTNV